MTNTFTVDDVDALLPQTQCGLCGFGACRPYAKAIAEKKAPIDLCPPGGKKTLRHLMALTGQTADLEHFTEKTSVRAIIREKDCIGCAKCLSACPVDAIVGAPKYMHTVIQTDCTGCELCVPACPVDCIELHPTQNDIPAPDILRKRYRAHLKRQAHTRQATEEHYQLAKNAYQQVQSHTEAIDARKKAIAEAVERAKKRKKSQ